MAVQDALTGHTYGYQFNVTCNGPDADRQWLQPYRNLYLGSL